MKNLFMFDLEFLKNHQTTKAYCNVCIESDSILNADNVLPQIKHMIADTFSDLSHLRIYRYTGQFTDAKQDPDTIWIGVSDGYKVVEEITRPIR